MGGLLPETDMKVTLDQICATNKITLPPVDSLTDWQGETVKILSYDQDALTVEVLTQSGVRRIIEIFE